MTTFSLIVPGPLLKMYGGAYFAGDLQRFQLARLYVCITTNIMTFGIICVHIEQGQNMKRDLARGGGQNCRLGAVRGLEGTCSISLYIKRGPELFTTFSTLY